MSEAFFAFLGFALGLLVKQLPLKEIILERWRERRGGLHRLERLLRLKEMSDAQKLAFPCLKELEAAGFTDRALPKAVEDCEEAWYLIVLVYLLAHKSWLISVTLDELDYVHGNRPSENADSYRHKFEVWWRCLGTIKETKAFEVFTAGEDVDLTMKLMQSYADYCTSPSRKTFKQWEARAF